MRLRQGMNVLDVGCGIGGPMRTMARVSGAEFTGVNISAQQIERGRQVTHAEHLENLCHLVHADFLHLPFSADRFDGAYQLEATCHAPDRRGVYAEVHRSLKPGAPFVGTEWCLTAGFDAKNPEHLRIQRGIEIGNGLPELISSQEVLASLEDVGFEIVEHRNLATEGSPETPWDSALSANWSLTGLKHSVLGQWLTHHAVKTIESLHLAQKGSTAVHDLLRGAGSSLVRGAQAGIFTPLYFVHARKPLSTS